MPIPTVFARPERLRTFGGTAAALAEGLGRRVHAARDGARTYGAGTEPAFEVPCDGLLDAVEGLERAVRELGEWVAEIGDAFAHLPTTQGVAFDFSGLLLGISGRPGADGGDGAGGGGEGSLADEVESLAGGALAGLRAGTAAGAARHPFVTASQLLAIVMALRAGAGEVANRWHADVGRPGWERVGRAGLDGALNTAGMLVGGTGGGAIGLAVCGGAGPVAAGCAPIAASFGSELGRRAGELVGDLLFGEEPAQWERDPVGLTGEIADLDPDSIADLALDLDEVAADAGDLAGRHTSFVLEHPWVWADTYHDAPVVAPPPPAPDVLVSGPR